MLHGEINFNILRRIKGMSFLEFYTHQVLTSSTISSDSASDFPGNRIFMSLRTNKVWLVRSSSSSLVLDCCKDSLLNLKEYRYLEGVLFHCATIIWKIFLGKNDALLIEKEKERKYNFFTFILRIKFLALNGYDSPRVSFTLPHSCVLVSSKY